MEAGRLVDVRSALSGESLSSFRLPSSSRVLHVKRRVRAAHEIGVLRQRLLWPAGRQLEDGELLAALGAGRRKEGPEALAVLLVRLEYVDADAGLGGQLLDAARRGEARALRRLLGVPLRPDYSVETQAQLSGDPAGATPLIVASAGGHLEAVRLLLEAGADKDKASQDGGTPLLHAARDGHLEVAQLLLRAGADKDKADRDGYTALIYAASEGYLEVVRLLLEAGADEDEADQSVARPVE